MQDSAEVRRSALGLINNCVCAPIDRSGLGQSCNVGSGSVSVNGGGGGASKTLFPPKEPGSVVRKKAPSKASEELINKIWDCVRANNGIMILLELIHIKSPITDADSLRALACKALVGLARSPAARQIMSKLPIFTNGQLQQLVREPVLLDQRMEHVKFQQHAYKLMTMVSASDDGMESVNVQLKHVFIRLYISSRWSSPARRRRRRRQRLLSRGASPRLRRRPDKDPILGEAAAADDAGVPLLTGPVRDGDRLAERGQPSPNGLLLLLPLLLFPAGADAPADERRGHAEGRAKVL